MATTFRTHSLHLQQHLQQSSSIQHPISHHLTFNSHHHISHHFQQQPPPLTLQLQTTQQQEQTGHFCKDCGVMFESSTSLEVHLSYHKENLLSRWATQDSTSTSGSSSGVNSSNSSISSVSSGIHSNSSNISVASSASSSTTMEKTIASHTPSPQASTDSITSGPVSSQTNTHHTQYFLDYVPVQSQYNNNNNNTSDHHMESSPNRPGANNFQPPVDPHLYSSIHHGYGTHPSHLYSSNPPSNDPNGPSNTNNSNTTSSSSGGGGNNLSNSSSSGGDAQRPPGGGENPPSREPAEILDLDSHKVHHVYQQQQHQQDRNFFHRPYLPHLLPPHPLPPGSNGWHDQFNPIGFPGSGDHRNPYGIPPPPSGNSYDLIRSEPNPIYSNDPQQPPPSSMGYGSAPSTTATTPGSAQQQGSTNSISTNLPPPTNGIRGGFNIGIGNSTSASGDRTRSPPHRSPPISTSNGGMSKSSSSIAPAAAPKTKGWKGGECKRPKTYNCSACNKWFTSSGHLKRHYGTTLHKNSIRQKGEGVEEPPVKGSNGKRSPGDSLPSGGDLASESSPTSSPSPRSIKLEDMNSGKSTPSQPLPSMYGSSTPSQQPPSSLSTRPSDISPFNNSSTPSSIGNSGANHSQTGGASPPNSTSAPGPLSSNPPYHPTGPSYLPPMSPYSSNNGPQQPPPPQQQQQQPYIPGHSSFHQVPPHPHQLHGTGIPFSNGYAPETMPMSNSSSIYSIPSPIVPTTLYGGYSVINGDSPTLPLPPFSTVGFSHYDPNSYHHLPSHQQQHTLMVSGYSVGTPTSMASPNRMTSGHQPYISPTSPNLNNNNSSSTTIMNDSSTNGNNINNNNNHLENSFDSENDHNRDSPEEIRSASTTASADGSLDGLDGLGSGSDGGSPNRVSSGESNKDGGECIKCPDCSKTFGRACYLTQHTNSSHSGKPFKCPTCGKRFPEAPALSDHVAKHGSDKPYKCSLCPKNFNHKTDLRRHLCLHTGEKPFVCHVCAKGFIRKDHMTKHCETHRKKEVKQS